MFNKKKILKVLFCVALMLPVFNIDHVQAFSTSQLLTEKQNQFRTYNWKNIYQDNQTYFSNYEFLKTVDLAPFIDKYGTDKTYRLEFDGRSMNGDKVMVYCQNGNNTKYQMDYMNGYYTVNGVNATFTKDFRHFSYDIKFKRKDNNEAKAMLAFYGVYNTGNHPEIKNISIKIAE